MERSAIDTPKWFNWRNILSIIFVTGTIGIACKFIALFDRWIFWPSFPNILDAAFLIMSVLYLALRKTGEN